MSEQPWIKKRRVKAQYTKTPRFIPMQYRRSTNYGAVARRPMGRGLAGELKFFDTSLSFTYDTTGEVPATGQLTLIPQGVTESTRVGRACTIKSVQIRGALTYNPAAGATGTATAYMYLVQDTQCNGAAAAATDVMSSATFNQAMINLDNSQRFRILKKWVIDFNPGAGVGTALNAVSAHIESYQKCNIKIDYDSSAATGAITTIRSNNIFLLAGSVGNAADDTITMAGICRLRFSDT